MCLDATRPGHQLSSTEDTRGIREKEQNNDPSNDVAIQPFRGHCGLQTSSVDGLMAADGPLIWRPLRHHRAASRDTNILIITYPCQNRCYRRRQAIRIATRKRLNKLASAGLIVKW